MIKLENKILIPKIKNNTTIDVCHNMLLFGLVLSLKPSRILEIGIGSGYITDTLIYAINYNQHGVLTCVDSCKDWQEKEPLHFQEIRKKGAKIIIEQEEFFIKKIKPNSFDLIISDADHKKSHTWIDKIACAVGDNGFIFFHDTNNDDFPNLKLNEKKMKEFNFNCFAFNKNSRSDERCERGWLMCFKNNT